jgi:hypothetical protein
VFPNGSGGQPLSCLATAPLIRFKDALEQLQNHETTKYHNTCTTRAENYLKIRRDETLPINQQVDKAYKEQALQNRNRLTPIVKTVIFCGRNELPLRGHRDSGILSEEDINDEVFRALLRFRIVAGDKDLAENLDSCGANATFCSPRIQNEIIEACAAVIQQKIKSDVERAKFFSVMSDETTDLSTTEQFSINLRYRISGHCDEEKQNLACIF